MDIRPQEKESTSCPWADAARKWPEAIGLIGPDGRSATWLDLHILIENTRSTLAEMPEGPIGLRVSNQPTDILVLVAALRSGRDVALFGSRSPQESTDLASRQLGLHIVEPSAIHESWRESEAIGSEAPEEAFTLTGSTLIRTSGSTGEARWIRHQAAAHVFSAAAAVERLALAPEHRWGWCLPAHHVGGLSILWRCALAGAAVVCQPEGMSLRDWLLTTSPNLFPTHLSLVPTQLKDVLEADISPPESFKSVIVGGAALSFHLLSRAVQASWPVRTTYGMTETASMITLSDIWSDDKGESVHAGPALNGVEIEERNGRLHVRTPALGQDLVDSGGWYATSDRARKEDNGCWAIEGRMDRVIISGGENLDPARIEHAILSMAGIEECIVVGIPDTRYGQRPIAFVSASDSVPNRDECAAALRTRLASFEIPDAIHPLPPLSAGETKWSRAQLEALAQSMGQS